MLLRLPSRDAIRRRSAARVLPTAPAASVASTGQTAPVTRIVAAAVSVPRPVVLLLVGLAGLALYAGTLAPTVLWGDDAELQRIVVTGQPRTIGQSSSASHLLWLTVASAFVRWSGWLPLDAAGRANLVSALAGAAALLFVAAAAAAMAEGVVSRPLVAGALAAAALGISHTFWLLAVRPDVYTLQTALLATALWCVLRWRQTSPKSEVRSRWSILFLLGAAGAVAAALANHAMILVSLPGLGALAWAGLGKRPRRVWIGVAVAGLIALLALLALAVANGSLRALLDTLLRFRPVRPGMRDVLLVPLYLLYQFPLSFLLAVSGALALWRRDRGALLGLLLLYTANVTLPLLVQLHDRFQFFLPSYLPVALLIGVGAGAIWDEGRKLTGVSPPARVPAARSGQTLRAWRFRRHTRWPATLAMLAVAAPLAVYPAAAATAGALAARLSPARTLPGRDPVAFYLLPGKAGYVGARAYGATALAELPPQAAVLADWLPYQTLRYLQEVEGKRPDVLLANINAGEGAQVRFLVDQHDQRPVYLADASPYPYYDIDTIEQCFVVTRQKVVFRLVWRPDAGAACR